MKKFLVSVIETCIDKTGYHQFNRRHLIEFETEDKEKDVKWRIYDMVKAKFPNQKHHHFFFYPLKDKLPDGWKKLDGTLTEPNGYYWASNGKSFFSDEYESALIKK